jgi:signal transduction histidine kinase
VRIEIEDDGKGFDPASVARREGRRSWGLMGIHERAEILGGTSRVESAPGQGTRVVVRIPLPKGLDAGAASPDADGGVEGSGTGTDTAPVDGRERQTERA